MATPPRKTAGDFDPEVLRLFDQYVHGLIDRRGFLAGAARFAVGATTAAGVLAALSPQFAAAQQVKPDDRRLLAKYLEFASPEGYGSARGYLARPAHASGIVAGGAGRAREPRPQSAYRRRGPTPGAGGFHRLRPGRAVPAGRLSRRRGQGACRIRQARPGEDPRRISWPPRGCCRASRAAMAAWESWASATAAASPISSPRNCPGCARSRRSTAARRRSRTCRRSRPRCWWCWPRPTSAINAAWPAYEAALKQARVHYASYQPAGTQHGFNNDTTPRYDEAAAREAWKRTLALFERSLRSVP